MRENEEFLRWSERWYNHVNCSKFCELDSKSAEAKRYDLKQEILLRVNALFLPDLFLVKKVKGEKEEELEYQEKIDAVMTETYLWGKSKLLEVDFFNNLTQEEEKLFELLLEIERNKVIVDDKEVSLLTKIANGNWCYIEENKREKIIETLQEIQKNGKWGIQEEDLEKVIFKIRYPFLYCFKSEMMKIGEYYDSLSQKYTYEEMNQKLDWEKVIKKLNSLDKKIRKEIREDIALPIFDEEVLENLFDEVIKEE